MTLPPVLVELIVLVVLLVWLWIFLGFLSDEDT
jgi:hypothetical protein